MRGYARIRSGMLCRVVCCASALHDGTSDLVQPWETPVETPAENPLLAPSHPRTPSFGDSVVVLRVCVDVCVSMQRPRGEG